MFIDLIFNFFVYYLFLFSFIFYCSFIHVFIIYCIMFLCTYVEKCWYLEVLMAIFVSSLFFERFVFPNTSPSYRR